MKKVGLLTLHPQMYNYGGFLQEMALQDALESLGMECEIINYSPANELNTFSIKRGIRHITAEKVLGRLRWTCRCRTVPDAVKKADRIRRQAFDTYREQALKMSKPLEYADLHSQRLPYDAIVCGSDQIWNPDFNIPAFFLDFAEEDQKKIIYAASMGKNHLTKLQKKVYSSLMENLDHISVREKSAREILASLARQPVELVLDPTMLHGRDYWQKKADASDKTCSRYIFCYFLELTGEKVAAARKFAQKHDCKIVAVPYLHGRFDPLCAELADISDADVSPADFLKLIRDAEYVLTDSFHAAVFSLVFQKKFWVFGRSVGTYNMNTRLDTLLDYFHAQERMIQPQDLEQKKDTNFCPNDGALDPMREKSFRFLRDALL